MVLIGKHTKCSLCGRPLDRDGTGMRHFVQNRKDPLAVFSGRAFHRRCFEAHPMRARAIEMSTLAKTKALSGQRCAVCGEPAGRRPLRTGMLTSEADHPLFAYNFVALHPEHLDSWAERASFENAIAEATRASRWEGETLQHQTGTLLAAPGRDR